MQFLKVVRYKVCVRRTKTVVRHLRSNIGTIVNIAQRSEHT